MPQRHVSESEPMPFENAKPIQRQWIAEIAEECWWWRPGASVAEAAAAKGGVNVLV